MEVLRDHLKALVDIARSMKLDMTAYLVEMAYVDVTEAIERKSDERSELQLKARPPAGR